VDAERVNPRMQVREEPCPVCGTILTISELFGSMIRTECPICTTKQKQIEQEQAARERVEEKARRKASSTTPQQQIKIGIPPKYHDRRLDEFPLAIGPITRFHAGEQNLIYIHGAIGTGKTSLLYILLRQYWVDRKPCSFYAMQQLMKELQARSGKDVRDEKKLLDEIMNFEGIVLLDDLGIGNQTPFTVADMLLLISEREKWSRSTAVTSNLSIEEVGRLLDPRLADRLNDGLVLELKGKSHRRPK